MKPHPEQPPSSARFEDHPWRRYPVELVLAIGVWSLFLLGFGAALEHSPAAVSAVAVPSATPGTGVAPGTPEPSPSSETSPKRTPRPTATPHPVPTPRPMSHLPLSQRRVPRSQVIVAFVRPLMDPSPKPVPSPSPLVARTSNAVALYKPLPTLSDDLRTQPLDVVAVARFHVAPDGSATVELAEPTPNAKLNQLLLDTLGTWKFYPALENGQPVASTLLFRIPIKIDQPSL
jgi:protein TonB